MKFLYYLILYRLLLNNPLIGLLVLIFIYLIVDRQFIGIFPDFLKPFKRRNKIKELTSEVSLNPANVYAYRELGLMYLEAKKFKLAVENLEKALNKMEDYADVHFNLGKGYYLLGEKEKGLVEIIKAIKINEKVGYGEPYLYLLETELSLRNQDKINELIKNIKSYATPDILYRAGKILKQYDRVNLAKEMFKEVLENYNFIPKTFKKKYRRWAFLARLNLIK